MILGLDALSTGPIWDHTLHAIFCPSIKTLPLLGEIIDMRGRRGSCGWFRGLGVSNWRRKREKSRGNNSVGMPFISLIFNSLTTQANLSNQVILEGKPEVKMIIIRHLNSLN